MFDIIKKIIGIVFVIRECPKVCVNLQTDVR